MRFQLEDSVLFKPVPPDKIILHIFLAPLSEKFAGVGLERVDAGKSFRRGVVPFHQLGRVVRAPRCLPACDQPFGMGIAEVRLLRLQFGQEARGGVGLAQVTAQDGVDESRLGVETALPGQLDGFVYGGVVGDAVEPEDLVEAEPQEVLEQGLLRACVRLAGDQPIEGGLPADDAIGQLLAEVAVGG